MGSSNLTHKGPCPKCGSKDNLAHFDDGHAHCFTPGCGHREWDGKTEGGKQMTAAKKGFTPLDGEIKSLGKRGINEETCAKFRYTVGEKAGKPVQIANYFDRDTQQLVGQKIRFPDKEFIVNGSISDHLYGAHLWGEPGRMIVITEGEIDALSVSQAQGNKWPVVSIPNGAQSAAKAIAKNLEWLEQYETVVLMFDNDDPGREAVESCVELFSPGKVKVASLPLKDANEMIKASRERELIDAIWRAKTYRPDGIVSVDDIIEQALQPVERGIPWFLPTLDAATFGRRLGEIYAIGAGTGVGKTDLLTQQIAHDISLGHVPAVFFLEQLPTETLARVAGKVKGKAFHVPDAGWTDEERKEAFAALRGKMFLYDSFGANEWSVIKQKIRYLAVTEGVKLFYVDHLTALADTTDEKGSLEGIMKEMASLAVELRIVITFVSHLSTPEGKPHEEGGRVTIRNFKGSRSIGFWSHFMFGLERNQQADDEEERGRTTFRVLKDRKTGRSTGLTFHLKYDHETTLLSEADEFGEPENEEF